MSYDYAIKMMAGDEMVKTTIRFPEKLYKRLKVEAKRQGLTVNAYILMELWELVRRKEGE